MIQTLPYSDGLIQKGSGGQERTGLRSESEQRSCPKGEDRPRPIRINRTTDTRIFSLLLYFTPRTRAKPVTCCGTFAGRQPPQMTANRLVHMHDVPIDWPGQREHLGFPAI